MGDSRRYCEGLGMLLSAGEEAIYTFLFVPYHEGEGRSADS